MSIKEMSREFSIKLQGLCICQGFSIFLKIFGRLVRASILLDVTISFHPVIGVLHFHWQGFHGYT